MEPIYEGKAKRLYTTDNPNVLRMEYKDDATAGNGAKKAQFENKGRMNKAITLVIYRMLESKGVKTHLVADVDDINIDVKKVSILPLEVIVRNIAAGSFSRRMGVKEGTPFKKPIVEFSYKDDSLGDPFINDDYAREMNAATEEECAFLKNQARIVNDVLIDFFKQAGLTLVDFKIEFGRLAEDPSQIVLVGHQDRREDGQRPLPPGPRQRDGSLRRSPFPAPEQGLSLFPPSHGSRSFRRPPFFILPHS